MAANRYRINHRAKKGSARDLMVLQELQQPDRLLSVILLLIHWLTTSLHH